MKQTVLQGCDHALEGKEGPFASDFKVKSYEYVENQINKNKIDYTGLLALLLMFRRIFLKSSLTEGKHNFLSRVEHVKN